jgi:hypothetical protein
MRVQTYLKYALFLTSLVKGMLAVFQLKLRPTKMSPSQQFALQTQFRSILRNSHSSSVSRKNRQSRCRMDHQIRRTYQVAKIGRQQVVECYRCQRNSGSSNCKNALWGAAEIAKSSSSWWATIASIIIVHKSPLFCMPPYTCH